jgi:hypothetical protein
LLQPPLYLRNLSLHRSVLGDRLPDQIDELTLELRSERNLTVDPRKPHQRTSICAAAFELLGPEAARDILKFLATIGLSGGSNLEPLEEFSLCFVPESSTSVESGVINTSRTVTYLL